jgi:hypothetical protein
MFSVEVKINGAVIVSVVGQNMGYTDSVEGLPHDTCDYKWAAVEYDAATLEPSTATGWLKHRRSAGIVPLVQDVLAAYRKAEKE